MASSLTIAPSLGHSVVSAQGMPGGYDAIDDRAFWGIGLQEGAVEAGAYKVTERGAGANMTIDVACDDGHVVVEGDSVTNQGLYVVRAHPTGANLDIAAADGTNPRNDIVVVQVDDDEHDSGGNTRARVMVLTGTPNASAALGDDPGENGTPALPDSAMLVAVVNVPASDTTISNAQIRDRRTWARGARYTSALGTTDAWGTGTPTAVTGTTVRLECSGELMRVRVHVRASSNTNATADRILHGLYMDGAAVTSAEHFQNQAASVDSGIDWIAEFTPAAGSHLFEIRRSRAGAGNYSDVGFQVSYEEIVQQNANNGTS